MNAVDLWQWIVVGSIGLAALAGLGYALVGAFRRTRVDDTDREGC